MHDFKAVAVRVSQFDRHIYFAAFSRLDLLPVFHQTDVEESRIAEYRYFKAQSFTSTLFEDLVFSGLIRRFLFLGDLGHLQLRSRRNPRVTVETYLYNIVIPVAGQKRLLNRRADDAVNGKALRGEFHSGHAHTVIGLHFRVDDRGLLIFMRVKMDCVDIRLLRHLDGFLVLNANLHLAGRLDLFLFILELYVIEPGKRQFRILIVLVLHLTQSLVVVLLVEFRFFFLRDLLDVEDHTHRQFGRRAKIGVDHIVLAFKNKLCVLCDQFKLFCGFAGLYCGARCGRFIAGIFCVGGTCFFGVSRVGVFRACAFACRTFISSFVVGIFCNSIFCIGRVSVFAVVRIFAVGRAFIIGI